MKLEFYKYHVNGNDFIIIEDLNNRIKNYSKLARELCKRRFSIGADGLLIINDSKVADFKMRIFNPDGSEAEMCGNGLACVSKYMYEKIGKQKLNVETLSGIKCVEIINNFVKLDMGRPKFEKEFKMKISDMEIYYVNTGVPHVVTFVKDLKNFDVINIGRKIRYDKRFKYGTNVNFVEEINEREFFVRTYERGVEDETFSCGTGLCAVATVVSILKGTSGKYNIYTLGGKSIVEIIKEGNEIKRIYLYVEPIFVFKGEILKDF